MTRLTYSGFSLAEAVIVSAALALVALIAYPSLVRARARVDRFTFGPPVGFPVQFRVVGPDPAKVREIAQQVREVMAATLELIDPHLDWSEQVKSIRLEVDQDRARALGLTPQDIAQTLQTLLSGYTVTQYREGIELIDVVDPSPPKLTGSICRTVSATPRRRMGVTEKAHSSLVEGVITIKLELVGSLMAAVSSSFCKEEGPGLARARDRRILPRC